MLFNIFDRRMNKIGHVDAVGAIDALKHAKRTHPGAAVERVLTQQEREQRDRAAEVEAWEYMRQM